MKILSFFFLSIFSFSSIIAQFPPAIGLPGNTAISAYANDIIGWADDGIMERGYQQIDDPSLGLATLGTIADALGPADGATVVSLGDGGVATLIFDNPITNGPGFDFAVFENGFMVDDSLGFLELAFVEVSSDGEYFVRFPAVSNTPTEEQVGPFMVLEASLINNLAGKYTVDWGTPFDLSELALDPQLDVNNITHVRLIDVVGDIGINGSDDSEGQRINDPFPTPFASGGFDLDAVGVIHQANPNSASVFANESTWSVFPNPVRSGGLVQIEPSASLSSATTINIINASGLLVQKMRWNGQAIEVDLPKGLYFVEIGSERRKLVVD